MRLYPQRDEAVVVMYHGEKVEDSFYEEETLDL